MTKVAVMDDAELLHLYAEQGSEAAFDELVRRYIGLVHSSALRLTHRPQLAQDVTQAVFIVLAKKAHRLGKVTSLAGWLFRTTRLAGAQAVRNELRSQRREKLAMAMVELETVGETDAAWVQAAPLLDEALAKLSARDRDAVLLRFFQNKPLKDVGLCLDCTEEAARKIVARALDKLRLLLSRRGVMLPVLTLGSALSAHSVQAAPASLTSSVGLIGVSKGASASSSGLELAGGIMKAMFMENAKWAAGLVAGTILLAMAPRAWPQQPGSIDPGFTYGLAGSSVGTLAFQPDGKILMAGTFPNAVVFVGGQSFSFTGLARLNYDGSADTSFAQSVTRYNWKPIAETDIFAMARQKDGKIVIGGYWTQPDAFKLTNIARLNPDGTLDPTFNPGGGTDFNPGGGPGTPPTPTSVVYKLAVQEDGKIVVGGTFRKIAGASRNGFARLNPDGTLDRSFDPAPAFSFVNLQKDGKIIVADTTNACSRLNPDGSIDLTFTPIPNSLLFQTFALQPDNRLIGTVGATFDSTSAALARFNPNGTRDTNFTATVTKVDAKISPYIVTSLALDQDGKILVVGRFDHVNGIQRFDIARLNQDGSTDPTFDAGPRIPNQVQAEHVFVAPDGKILVSGSTKTNNINNYYLMRLRGNGPLQFITFRRTLGGLVQGSLEVQEARPIGIETSFNLREWLPTITLTNGPVAGILSFSIQATPDTRSAYYRAVLQ